MVAVRIERKGVRVELEEGCEEERVRSMVYGGVGGQERVGGDRGRTERVGGDKGGESLLTASET